MISRETIEKVNDLLLSTVINKYHPLKKSGSGFKANCPFHNEKSGSFMVSDSKNVYKCFGCGAGGNNPISFVMKHLNLSYPDTIKEICGQFNVDIIYDDTEKAAADMQRREKEQTVLDINSKAALYFAKNAETQNANVLRVGKSTADKFDIGYADEDFQGLIKHLNSIGINKKAIINAGLATAKDDKEYDFFNNRVIFPIWDWKQNIIGFGGRQHDWKKGDKSPKYLNSKSTDAYNKMQALYGLRKEVVRAIRSSEHANVSEGFYDVIAMQEIKDEGNYPFLNTVAPNGTAFTPEQLDVLIKNNVKKISFYTDGDAAGKKSALKGIEMCLAKSVTTEICILPDGEDPDSYQSELLVYSQENIQDGLDFLANEYFANAKTPSEQLIAQQQVENILSLIEDVRIRNFYVNRICKKHPITRSEVEKNIKTIIQLNKKDDAQEKRFKFPKGANAEDFETFGFCEVHTKGSKDTGYWFPNQGLTFEKQSNFIIKPLFHIRSKTNNKRLIKIVNHKKEAIIELPSKDFVTVSKFEEAVGDEGYFLFDGTKQHFQKIKHKIFEAFRVCDEIKTMGWQQEGFYAFANGIIDNQFKEVDSFGIVEFGEDSYFLPAFSSVYKQVRSEDDMFENDRWFTYRSNNITFGDWNKQFINVHGDHGIVGTAFIVASLFRDIVYNIHKVFPHLFLFGGIDTGKSYFARSINSIFFGKEPGFNLNSGTPVGFYRTLAKARNAVSWFDEYSNDIDEKRFQSLKAAFDGLGHTKGVMSKDNRVETTKVESAAIISGQYLPTRDDNSLNTRSLVLTFDKKSTEYTKDELKKAKYLKDLEDQGLSKIIECIVVYREVIEDEIADATHDVKEQLKLDLNGESHSGRILQNYAMILAPVKVLEDKLDFAFDYQKLYDIAKVQIIEQSDAVADSDALRSFLKMIEFLYAEKAIKYGIDFKIETESYVTIKDGRKEKEAHGFEKPTKVLYLRLTRIFPKYMEAHRKQMGENGVGEGSLKSYMKSNKAFIGNCPATAFEDTKTSAYCFDYDKLNINLEGLLPETDEKDEDKADDNPF